MAFRAAKRLAPGTALLRRAVPRLPVMPPRLFAAPASTLAQPQMLCYQCEQTSAGQGCTTLGVCSKTPQIAGLQDLVVLYGLRLCQLAHAMGPGFAEEEECRALLTSSMFATLTNVNFDQERFDDYVLQAAALCSKLEAAAGAAAPPPLAGLPSSLPSDPKGRLLASKDSGLLARSARVNNDDLFGVTEMTIYGLKGLMAYFTHAEHLHVGPSEEKDAICSEMFRIGSYLAEASTQPAKDGALEVALAEALAVGALNLQVMKLLDASHVAQLGTPGITEVSTVPTAGKPAILVSGHDMASLQKLLEQSAGKGVDVYTHGEMLPAHSYPKLRAHEHLRGHFGTHWGNQLAEFRHFPGPIVMTSNCLRPPTSKYKDRLWTTGPVGFSGQPAVVNEEYGPVIDQALSLPVIVEGINEKALRGKPMPEKLTIGFGHDAILSVADKVVEAVKAKQLNHIFVIGGCDGTETARSYFTDLAAATPPDSIILTLGCGKFRVNQTDHGTLGGLPRLLDVGQCNDAYGAVVVASKLAEALGCSVGDLPLHFAVSWFEQKAVAVLLTLLHLQLKNIRIGPAVPAFLTPSVAELLNKEFGLRPIDNLHETDDLNAMLAGN